MPSGVSEAQANAAVDALVDAMGTVYLDLLTAAPDDDEGTGAVSWGEGRVAVDMTDASIFPDAADRQTTSSAIVSATNTSGDTITVVAFGWYSASTLGTYKGGAPVAGGTADIDDGQSISLTVTLGSPSPSD